MVNNYKICKEVLNNIFPNNSLNKINENAYKYISLISYYCSSNFFNIS